MELALSGCNITESEGAGDCGNRNLRLGLEAEQPLSLRGRELHHWEDCRAPGTWPELWRLHSGKQKNLKNGFPIILLLSS